MARKKNGARILGPYANRRHWQLICIDAAGNRRSVFYDKKGEAEKAKGKMQGALKVFEGTWEKMQVEYRDYMHEKGNQGPSIKNTIERLGKWFDCDTIVRNMSFKSVKDIYDRRCSEVAPGTHRGELSEVKTFFNFLVKQKHITKNPASGIEGKGKKADGEKEQLRYGEAQTFSKACYHSAQKGSEGALAALACLWLGLRSTEIRARVRRDLDTLQDGSRYLWITKAKTPKGNRVVKVHPDLADLLSNLAKGKGAQDYLFPASSKTGYRTATWLRRCVRRLCVAAGVPVVSPQGLRGTWASMAHEAGIDETALANHLGHESIRTTHKHYARPSAVRQAMNDKAWSVLEGGK